METSEMEEKMEVEVIQNSMENISIFPCHHEEEAAVAGPPHEALFVVLTYLPLYELLAMSEVCKSLRHTVNNDVLQWLVVQGPLNWRLSDEILVKLSSKMNGKITTLGLISCVKITDSALLQVVRNNPLINTLHIPGCIGLSPEGIIKAVEILSKQNKTLKSLQLAGIYSIKKEHLETLHSHLKLNSSDPQNQNQPLLYHEYRNSSSHLPASDRQIDVEMCPRCNQVRVVFECAKVLCNIKDKKSKWFRECKGCCVCIPRCAQCGGCMDYLEQEETACMDILCSECWLHLPKCDFCNKPYCKRHALQQTVSPGSSGFLCDVCQDVSQDFYVIG
ncbi:F-box protein SKIP28-like [Pistacia vera]|uniref:F-box protein SKIP28-like n=1 Tax=Pistacia vera TaxID=55513 RepID=UPI001263AA93|nr:F-box protein SKIP28-like [Pistacia vera]